MTTTNVIEVHGLQKNYGDVKALKGVELNVFKGEIFGLLGPNGAGKSTLIKSLVGALKPSAGSIKVAGFDLPAQRKGLQKILGYMPQAPALYEDISVRDNIRFFASSHGIKNIDEKVNNVIKFTALEDKRNKAVRTLSGGMKQRVSLACALVHEPQVLFLDEPTAGVDPQLRDSFWRYFRELADRGTTIFITTHLMDEAEYCDRLGIIQSGRILQVNTVEKILAIGDEVISIKANNQWQKITQSNSNLAETLHPFGLKSEVTDIRIQRESLQQIILKLCEEGDAE